MTLGSAKPAAYFMVFRMVGASWSNLPIERMSFKSRSKWALSFALPNGPAGRKTFLPFSMCFCFLSLGRRLQLGLKSVAAQRPTKRNAGTGIAHSRKHRNLNPTSSRANRSTTLSARRSEPRPDEEPLEQKGVPGDNTQQLCRAWHLAAPYHVMRTTRT